MIIMTQTRISIRIDDDVKDQAKKLYDELGLDMSTAITLFLKQSIREQSLPFSVKLDSRENIQARHDAHTGENLHSVSSVEDLMKELNDED